MSERVTIFTPPMYEDILIVPVDQGDSEQGFIEIDESKLCQSPLRDIDNESFVQLFMLMLEKGFVSH